MKINKNGVEYDVDFKLPSELENSISIKGIMDEWIDIFNKQELKKKKDLRLRKLNRINNLNKKK